MVIPLSLPIIDLSLYTSDPSSPDAIQVCIQACDALITYGALLIRDPRIPRNANEDFLDMMEQYFEQPLATKLIDVRKDLHYQIGATPEFTEEPRCLRDPTCRDLIDQLPSTDKPISWNGADPKWRFFHRIGPVPSHSKYPSLNSSPVIPNLFTDRWLSIMNGYGQQLHDAVDLLTEMIAVGFGFNNPKTFVNMTKFGPHLLAPTGSDLNRFNQLGTVLAGFHYDLNFLTIHGKSRYPGLHIWARNTGAKMSVSVPDGCLLVQAGKQLEWLTGGVVLAGYHEVIVTENTLEVIHQAQQQGKSLWRVSSTLFYHIASDQILTPLPPFINKANAQQHYPSIECGEFVKNELEMIALATS